ncbi:MAG: hypothetical protein BGO69_11800 [Bacteroidetes bacterium 46-16]|nr:MAG: hypothetical protein BGO69_11800 [Bacteroidetes bacterium 46-16]
MKTKQLRILLQELSGLNNSFTHYFFVWTQFTLDYRQVIAANGDKFTSAIFQENSFSKKQNIELAKLDKEHMKTNDTLLNGIFTLIYSSFENYLNDIYSLAKNIDSSLPELNEGKFENDDILVLKVFNRLKINQEKVEHKYLMTLDYIRLKRNRLIHQSSPKISRSLRDIINKMGQELNFFWNKVLPKQLRGIDFTSNDNANQITYNILIDALNIIRGIANYVDEVVLSTFQQSEFLLKEVLVEFKNINGYKNYNLTNTKNKKRFLGFCKSEYGYEPNEYDLQAMV